MQVLQRNKFFEFVGLSNIGYTLPTEQGQEKGGDFFGYTAAEKILPDLDPSSK